MQSLLLGAYVETTDGKVSGNVVHICDSATISSVGLHLIVKNGQKLIQIHFSGIRDVRLSDGTGALAAPVDAPELPADSEPGDKNKPASAPSAAVKNKIDALREEAAKLVKAGGQPK